MESFFIFYAVIAAIGLIVFGAIMVGALCEGDRPEAIVLARLALGSLVWPLAIPASLIWLAFQKI